MSAQEDAVVEPVPCILVSSSDPGFKEEELIKREFCTKQINRLTCYHS